VLPTALPEETECLLHWLEEPGTRLVQASHPWLMPAFGAGGLQAYLVCDPGRTADPFTDRRRLPVVARPTRASA
jgi:DNA polymerase-3 subunit epsilon